MDTISIIHYDRKIGDNLYDCSRFGPEHAKEVLDYHKSFPDYNETPLVNLQNLAKKLGIKSLHVKDESYRYGLNAFKVLGGSYSVGKLIAEKLNLNLKDLPYSKLVSKEIKDKLGQLTFITASDGNHGRGIAWIANKLEQKSIVYMPKGTAQDRLNNIKKLGCDASIVEMNYDGARNLAEKQANENGYLLVLDTAYEGYEKIPGWIMEGYSAMGIEIINQLEKEGKQEKITHVFLQCGVGAFAGAMTGFFASYYGDKDRPIITIVEPTKVNCVYRTAEANDGKLRFITGDLDSIMAGLCCGEPCTIGWYVMRDHADNFLSVPDCIAAKGMRILGNPLRGDTKIISGESGAVTSGVVCEILMNPKYKDIKEKLKLDENSNVLCVSTEGDTDYDNYLNIVWDGKYESYNK